VSPATKFHHNNSITISEHQNQENVIWTLFAHS